MPFWSGQRLRQNIDQIIDKPDARQIDGAAYTLHIGPEIYITPHVEIRDPQSHTKHQLGEREPFCIPPGQFAYLLTEERVTIPYNKIGFISVKASIKFKGLVNVSGFHVDPGWSGRLIFSVYNAGPVSIHLHRGAQAFLLWIADLDDSAIAADAKDGRKPETIPSRLADIPVNLIGNIPGEIHSLQSVSKRIDDLDIKLKLFTQKMAIYATIVTFVLSIVIGAVVRYGPNLIASTPPTPSSSVPQNSSPRGP